MPSKKIRIGIGTYALAWSIGVPGHKPEEPMDALAFINYTAKEGAQCIQIADNIPLDTLEHNTLLRLRDRTAQLSLPVEVGLRGLTQARVHDYLEICRIFNCRLLRAVIDADNYRPTLEEIIHLIKKLIPALREANVRLALENHDRLSWSDFLHIIKSTDVTWVGICLDSVNSLGKGEGFFQVADQLLPYTINLHVKDYMIERKSHNMGFDVYGAVAGEGMLPIPWLFEQVKKYNRCNSAILELWTPPESTLARTIVKERLWLQKSMSYLQSL